MHDWSVYYDAVGNTPNSLVVGVLADYSPGRQAALDLGSGNFRDSVLLRDEGFEQVVSVDSCEDTPPVPEGITFVQMPIEEYRPTRDTFDLIICCNTLFFVPKENVLQILSRAKEALRPSGIFAGNVLGERDGWVSEGRKVSYFTREDMLSLQNKYKILGFGESERDAHVASGKPKHWHTKSLVFRK